ncbi:hypothetical protein Pmani_002860 [Petrolisthes manimaculis]|uniref:Uncharacterized protein n=1 Tax=Petrolisthes manimaculis TaxID=1843537 RepID=A0AAE1QJK2_9EUCA|nr:hypothetical protein Pmani_002860 [Petrolisthes manimaculis]
MRSSSGRCGREIELRPLVQPWVAHYHYVLHHRHYLACRRWYSVHGALFVPKVLDDLSSDSDDEYFDVVPLPGLRPPPLPSSPAPASPATKPQIPPHLPPTHSQSLPSVNKSLAAGKMGNFQGQTATTAKPPETTNATHGNGMQQTLANSMTQQIVPNASPGGTLTRTSASMVTQQTGDKVIIPHKKYQAPQPPNTRNGLPYKQDDTHSLKSLPATTNEHPYTTTLEKRYAVRDPSVSSLVDKVGTDLSSPGKYSVAASSESLTTYATRDNKIGKDTQKARRVPSFKKYPAPQPPGSSSRPSSTLIKDLIDDSSLTTTSLTSLTSLSSYQSLKTESTKVSKEDLVQPSGPFGVSDKIEKSAYIANKKPLNSEAQPVTVETQNNTTTTSVHSPIKHLDTNNVDGTPTTGHKVRAGSPVPDMPAIKDLTAKKAVLKGKLEIATNDGSAIVKTEEGKVALQIKGPKVNKDAKPSEPGKVELDEKISNKTPILGKKETQSSTGKKEEILVNGFKDDAPLKTDDEKSHNKSAPEVSKKAEKQKYSKINEKTDSTKDNNIGSKTSEPQVNGDCDEVNTAKEKDKASKNKDISKQKSSVSDKNNEATKVTDEKLCNGVHVEGEQTTDKDDKKVKQKSKKTSQSKENNNEANSERESRCNSVASDISSAVSTDVSQKSVYKRTKSGKLASVLNKFEAEDVSQASEKIKPKSSAPKVGKITGLASKFEGGTPVAPKLDLNKIKSPYSGPFSPERKAPEPKTKDIAGINMAKFGSLAKFKKSSPGDKKEEDEKTKDEEVKTNDEKEKIKDEKEKTKEIKEKLKDEKEIPVSKDEKKKVKTKEDKSTTSASSKSDLGKMNVDKEVTCKKDGKEGNSVNLKETEDSKKTDVKENKKKASTGDQNCTTAGKEEIVPLVNGEVSIAESGVSSSDKKKKTKPKADAATDVTTSAPLPTKSPESKKKIDDKASVKSKTTDSESVKDKSKIPANKKIKSETTEVDTEESKTQDKLSEAQNVKSNVSVPNDVIVKPCEQTVKSFEANKSEGVKIIVNKSPSGNDKENVETKEESESSKVEKLATIKTEIHEPVIQTHDNNVRSDVNKEPVITITEDTDTKAVEPKITDSKSPTSEEVAKESVVVSDVPAVVEKIRSEEISINISTDASAQKTLAKNDAEDATVISSNSTTHNVAAVDSALALAQPGNHSAASDLAAGDKPTVSAEILSVRPKSLDLLKKESQSTDNSGKVESLEQLKQVSMVSDINKVQSVNADTCVGALSVRPRESSVTSEFSVDNMSRGSVYKYLEQDMTAMSKIDEKPNHTFSRATCDIRRKINEAIARTSTVLPQLESQVQAMVREASTFLETGMAGARASVSPCRTMLPLAVRAASSGDDDDEVFEDAVDPSQLDTLMPLPDVPAERERRSRSRTPLLDGPERSSSAKCLVAQTEALLSETDRLLRRSRSDKSLRLAYTRSLSSAALNKSAQDVLEARCELFANDMMMTRNLAEVTADLSEEHNTAHLAGERLEAEQAERMKLEKEVERLHENVRAMTTANGRLEEERQVLKSEVLRSEVINGDAHDDDDDDEHDASLYKRKYQWSLREMELLKKQLKQQQEDDLDHLLLLKKQLEKKVADAYEETEEQRQVVAQMKRKSQRLQAEMNDLKILLEEQTSRNNLLEKKQRKFDQDMLVVQEELRHEKTNKDKIQREKDQILSEKYSYEQEVSTPFNSPTHTRFPSSISIPRQQQHPLSRPPHRSSTTLTPTHFSPITIISPLIQHHYHLTTHPTPLSPHHSSKPITTHLTF